MKCKNCGVEFDKGVFCPECGTKNEERYDKEVSVNSSMAGKRCNNCGAELDDNTIFCDECGSLLINELQQGVSKTTKDEKEIHQNKKLLSETNSGKGIALKEKSKKHIFAKARLICSIIVTTIFCMFLFFTFFIDSEKNTNTSVPEKYFSENMDLKNEESSQSLDFDSKWYIDNYVFQNEKGTVLLLGRYTYGSTPILFEFDNHSVFSVYSTEYELKDDCAVYESEDGYKVYYYWVDNKLEVVGGDGQYNAYYYPANEDILTADEEKTNTDGKTLEDMKAVDSSEFTGVWYDPLNPRCYMEIICQNDTYYDIKVDWVNSVWENSHWEIFGEYDAEQGGIVYQNGCLYERYYSEDGGEMQETKIYDDGEGIIHIEDGKLYWDEKVEATDSLIFERQEDTEESDYILPDSSNVRLTEADISHLSLQELNYAKNEIYARHGRIFQSRELQDYFESKSWYNGFIEASDFDEDSLSPIEKDNIRLLKEAEFSIDPNGYQFD